MNTGVQSVETDRGIEPDGQVHWCASRVEQLSEDLLAGCGAQLPRATANPVRPGEDLHGSPTSALQRPSTICVWNRTLAPATGHWPLATPTCNGCGKDMPADASWPSPLT